MRRRNAEHTRAALLDAATAAFCLRGYAGARIDDIAESADTNKRMIYHYFGDKAGLFGAVLAARLLSDDQAESTSGLDPVGVQLLLAARNGDRDAQGHADAVLDLLMADGDDSDQVIALALDLLGGAFPDRFAEAAAKARRNLEERRARLLDMEAALARAAKPRIKLTPRVSSTKPPV